MLLEKVKPQFRIRVDFISAEETITRTEAFVMGWAADAYVAGKRDLLILASSQVIDNLLKKVSRSAP